MASVAIVGISAELPSGAVSDRNLDYNSFFSFLLEGRMAYERIPSARFNIDAWYGRHPGRIHADAGTFLKGIDLFDNVEFGVSSQEALNMAPVTRKLLENTFLALLDSGIEFRMRNVGCFTSANSIDLMNVSEPDEYDARGSLAGHPSMVANRISMHLDLLGPSLPTDTACSATLTAFHLAIQAVSHGECEAAVVAGCQLNHRFIDWFTYGQASLLAKDGVCKPFDASANGFSRGEGCVAIVIKPLADALRDHDRIYATVLGTAINSSGGGAPPGAPVAEAQREAMLQAFKRAGRRPQEVDFVELHATGTAKGDPTETNWVGAEFRRDDELLIGSTKGNIGHTEIVSFLASLTKVLSIIQSRIIPPAVNLRNLNPAIKWDEYKLRVPIHPTPLPCRSGEKPLIAMASYGIGGSNGFAVLEGPPSPAMLNSRVKSGPIVLMACGLSSRSASAIGESLQNWLDTNSEDLRALSTVLGRRAKQMTWRSYAISGVTPSNTISFSVPRHCPRAKNPVVFLFSGQGPQHINMGRELFAHFPAFRESIIDMDGIYTRVTGKSLIQDHGLFGEGVSTKLGETWPISLILPSITIFQIAFFDLMVSLGIRPDIVLGHSAGETAVLYAAGAGCKAMVVELAILRGRVFSSIESLGGTMAAVSCSPQETRSMIDEVIREHAGAILEVACYNSPSAVAVSGDEAAIDCLSKIANGRGQFCRKIRTRVPIHSSMMEHCRGQYVAGLRDLFERYPGHYTPQIPTYSTLTGKRFNGPYDPDYFWMTTRNPVRFTEAIQAIAESSSSTTVEISPHPVLSSYVSSMMREGSAVFASTRRAKSNQPSSEHRNALELCAQLTVTGHNCVDFTALNGRACHELNASLPEYPFLRKLFPLYPETQGWVKQMEPQRGPLNHPYLKVNKDTHPTLAEHVIRGEPIMPAVGFIEMALEFGATALMDVNMRAILSLSSEKPTKVNVSLDGSCWTVKTVTRSSTINGTLTSMEKLHADGYLTFEPSPQCEPVDISAIRQRCESYVGSAFYQTLAYFSEYGPRFRRVTNVYYGYGEALVSIRGMDETLRSDGRYLLHPAILDACLHVSAHKAFHGDSSPNSYYLPAHVDSVILHCPSRTNYFPAHVYAHVVLKKWTPASIYYDVVVVDYVGNALCTMKMLEAVKYRINPPPDTAVPFEVALQAAAVPIPVPAGVTQVPPCSAEQVTQTATGSPDLCKHNTSSVPENTVKTKLFDLLEAFMFHYSYGNETDLQWDLGGLDAAAPLDIWILTKEGRDGSAALGLVRALRHEFQMWRMRLVIFPSCYDEEACMAYLNSLPAWMEDELEIILDAKGNTLVPRMVSLPSNRVKAPPGSRAFATSSTSHGILVNVRAVSRQTAFTGIFGIEERTEDNLSQILRPVIGLALGIPAKHTYLAQQMSSYISQRVTEYALVAVEAIPGLVAAILAQGLHTLNAPERVKSLHVLITHSDTVTGISIHRFYASQGISIVALPKGISLLALASMRHRPFDIILSGYQDRGYIQIMQTLLTSEGGKMSLWAEGLLEPFQNGPWVVKDALDAALAFVEKHAEDIQGDICPLLTVDTDSRVTYPSPDIHEGSIQAGFSCDPQKTYLILGGIGSLGAYIALLLYQRGARTIVLTSRRGAGSVYTNPNRIVRRMFDYLAGIGDLKIVLEAVDAANRASMKTLIDSFQSSLGGCIVLTAVLRDRTFPNLVEADFADVFTSKLGVIEALSDTMDVASLDFLIAFSSVVGLFGNGGQANYAAANTAMEDRLSSLKNAFSFVCPGILDSSMLMAGRDSSIVTHANHFAGWCLTAEDMILWLDDAITRLQQGEHFVRYVPSLDWEALDRTLGMPIIGKHLLAQQVQEQITTIDDIDRMATIIRGVLSIPLADFSPETPLTTYGIDSLSAARLSFLLRPMLEISQLQLLADISLNDLRDKLTGTAANEVHGCIEPSATINREEQMRALLAKYSKGMRPIPITHSAELNTDHVVVVTGTTGALGCNILFQLLQKSNVKLVYALNRGETNGSSLPSRQGAAFRSQGLPQTPAGSTKLILVECDLRSQDLGINQSLMHQMLSHVTHVVHNAWKVDLSSRLEDFEDMILGTRILIDLALNSKQSARATFSFVSSIGIYRHPQSSLPAPEKAITDPKVSVDTGYTESKWVAERLTQLASENTSLRTNVIRTGLLTGGVNGYWDTSHWFPALVQSAVYVGCLPEGNDEISWIPIHVAAAAIVDLSSTTQGTLHVNHPRPVRWSTIMTPLANILDVPLVPYVEWFARLESIAADDSLQERTSDGHQRAAIKLIDFFQQGIIPRDRLSPTESMGFMPQVMMEKGKRASAALGDPDLPQLGRKDVERWVTYWREIGFLPTSQHV